MGLDLGLEAACLDIAVALECNPCPVATIVRNRPLLPLIDRPIEDVSSDEILETAQLEPGESFAVVGGPSCQVFSTAGQRQSLGDPRSTMFTHFVRVVSAGLEFVCVFGNTDASASERGRTRVCYSSSCHGPREGISSLVRFNRRRLATALGDEALGDRGTSQRWASIQPTT